ncbi:MAG: tRNA (N6-isopentenyl adenosine(37)-C2)-methylthiotransferase MiaB [Clostridia bacterium]|nr:tRNA (N6-isopentenyl adenosine(37)-C2)-methylthiotransferase MiaB [Clostridia bacterium]
MENKTHFPTHQDIYIKSIKKLFLSHFSDNIPLAVVKTYGCQQNFSDSEKIKGILKNIGFDFTTDEKKADLIIFNTCAIREHAEDRIFGNIGALKNIKKEKPDLIIAVCGCMTEQESVEEKIKRSFPFVDLILGTDSIYHLPQMLYSAMKERDKIIVERGKSRDIIDEDIPTFRGNKLKASVPIMYGCDNFCSYCIVPYVRGREKSRAPESVISEIKELVDKGYKDITLLGQNVNSYGKGLGEKINFADLLKKIDAINGEFWVRFMTSHPKDASFELIDTIAQSKHICHHLHLPFQSGNNRILKEMNRHYNRERYLSIVNYAKMKIPDIILTSDVIVGFPSETTEEFEDTLSLIKEVKFSSLFTFIYSKRPGTPASKMEDKTSKKEKQERFRRLLELQSSISDEIYREQIGKIEKVLVECASPNEGKLTCRTGGGIVVEIKGKKDLIGKFADVEITGARRCNLLGEVCGD